jgi:hypothetical protein
MKIQDFEKELKDINPELSIKASPTKGLAGVYFKDVYMFACPADEIFEEKKSGYGIDGPRGELLPHRTRMEVIDLVKAQLLRMEVDKDYRDAFFGEGEYSDSSLR